MSHPQLDAFIGAALDLRASDLHLIAGVPPSFRVNGDILFADHDALATELIGELCESILTEEQKTHFAREWELCISIPHEQAGRIVFPSPRPRRIFGMPPNKCACQMSIKLDRHVDHDRAVFIDPRFKATRQRDRAISSRCTAAVSIPTTHSA